MNFVLAIILPSLFSFAITLTIIPSWIKVCKKWNLFEKTDERKVHKESIPTMGGLAIFAGILISYLFLGQQISEHTIQFLIAASLILFFTGFFDDLLDMNAKKKLVLQIIASAVVAYGGIRINNLYGILGIYEIPIWLQYTITILFIVSITNAYNLVDGIDGLAGSLGLMSSLIFGGLFYQFKYIDYAILSFCMSGALIGFLKFNFHPAKIFMGDTGSLIIGFFLSTLAINLLDIKEIPNVKANFVSPALIAAVLFVPLYDVIRVCVIRILTGNSPLQADRNHVHHMIVAQGFGQRVTTTIIVAINLMIISFAILFRNMNINLFLLMSICLGMITINTLVMTKLAFIYGKLGGRINQKSVRTT